MHNQNSQEILVSIICDCYNHEKFIRQCLDGFIMQKCEYKFEVLIHDDASTDDSAEIIKEYESKYPNIIKPIYQTENKYSTTENIWTEYQFPRAKGKYIAICEGDDYWTDPLKLQKQIDFLEANEDYVLCFHKVNILKPTGEIVEDFITKVPEGFELRETLAKNANYIHTPSVVFKNVLKEEYKKREFQNSPIGDYFLYLLITNHGKIGFLNETMAIYRYGVGVFSSLNSYSHLKMNILLFANLYANESEENIKDIFYKNLNNSLNRLVTDASSSKKLLGTRRHRLVEKVYNKIKRK